MAESPFLAFVADRIQFDEKFREYVKQDYVRFKYETLFLGVNRKSIADIFGQVSGSLWLREYDAAGNEGLLRTIHTNGSVLEDDTRLEGGVCDGRQCCGAGLR